MPLLLSVLLLALCILRIPTVVKVRESRSSWLASVFGLLALFFLGTITPLNVIDSYLGGINITNLLQSIFALLAFFFFNDSVRQLANVKSVRWTYYAPLMSIPIMVFCFALIEDKAPTAADFIVPRMDQLSTAAYSGTYMLAVLFTVLRVIYMLRQKLWSLYATFSAGLFVVAVACLCHILYVAIFHLSPSHEVARAIGDWFDRLFYLGLSITATGWLILFFSKRISTIRIWFIDALYLAAARIRLKTDLPRSTPALEIFKETLEEACYRSIIVLHNYEIINSIKLPENIQARLDRVEARLDARS